MSPTESCLYTDFFVSCLLNRKRYTFPKKEGSKGVSKYTHERKYTIEKMFNKKFIKEDRVKRK